MADATGARLRSRPQLAGAVALLLLSTGLFAQRCIFDPAIPFVVQDADAPWIAFPTPPHGLMGLAERDAPPVTHFVRRFEWPAGSPTARLRVRAMRSLRAWLNGEPLPALSAGPDRHWRRFRRIELSGLRPGQNELRLDVTNPTGPALLSVRLEAAGAPLLSDARWLVSIDGGPTEPAIEVGVERVNPSGYAMPSPAESLVARRDTLLLCFVLALLAFAATQREPGRRWLPNLSAALPVLLALAWTGLFVTTWLGIPTRIGFDAHHHVAYVDFLREHGQLPLASDGWMMFHPPVYYAITAGLVALQESLTSAPSGLLAWKLPGFLAGLASVLLCAALARRVFGAESREAALATLFAAILPMNLYISAYVTNESLQASFATALVLVTSALLLAPGTRTPGLVLWAGIVGLGVLTKYTVWLVAGVAGFFLLLKWARIERARPAALAARVALCSAVVLALAGWWYARNLVHFGQPFPLNVDLPGETRQWWSQPGYYMPAFFLRFGEVLAHPFLAGTHTAWNSLYATLWGDGQLAGQVHAAGRHHFWDWELMAAGYWLALPATGLLGLGAVRSLRLAFSAPDERQRALHSFLLTLVWTLVLSVLYMTLRMQDYGQVKAFYGLALIAPLSIFFALGAGTLDRFLEGRRLVWARALFYGWLGAFAGVVLLSLAG